MSRFFNISILFILLVSPLIGACTTTTTMVDHMPEYVQMSPPRVQVAYQYALEHPDMLEFQPCYCGCGPMGHLNNLDCFIQDMDEAGNVIYDPHASGCGICVDIALDVKRMQEEGRWSSLQIRLYVDATYGQFGPSTDTPMPEA